MPYSAQKDKEFPRLLCTGSNLLLFKAQRNWRVPHGSTPHSGRGTVLLHPSEHRCPLLSTLSEPLSKQLVSVLAQPRGWLWPSQSYSVQLRLPCSLWINYPFPRSCTAASI